MEVILGVHAGQKRGGRVDSSDSEEHEGPSKAARVDDPLSDTEEEFQEVRRRGRPRWNSIAPRGSQDIRQLIVSETPAPS